MDYLESTEKMDSLVLMVPRVTMENVSKRVAPIAQLEKEDLLENPEPLAAMEIVALMVLKEIQVSLA